MNTLIITAHPSTSGVTHKIARAYKDAAEERGSAVKLVNLYREESYKQEFLAFEEMRGEWTGRGARVQAHTDLTWADEIVFAFPVWWSGMPAILKNYIDNNFTSGFAFQYVDGKPVGLLKDKTARVFATADMPKSMAMILKPMLGLMYGKAIFGFCGIKMTSFDLFAEMYKRRTSKGREEIVARVQSRA